MDTLKVSALVDTDALISEGLLSEVVNGRTEVERAFTTDIKCPIRIDSNLRGLIHMKLHEDGDWYCVLTDGSGCVTFKVKSKASDSGALGLLVKCINAGLKEYKRQK